MLNNELYHQPRVMHVASLIRVSCGTELWRHLENVLTYEVLMGSNNVQVKINTEKQTHTSTVLIILSFNPLISCSHSFQPLM